MIEQRKFNPEKELRIKGKKERTKEKGGILRKRKDRKQESKDG